MHLNRVFRRPDLAVLFVCTANVCRSPMAEGLLRREFQLRGLARAIKVDSAGTHAGQPGRPPDPRAQKVCLQAGVDIRRCRARQIRGRDFERFDHILAMDEKNYSWLVETCPKIFAAKISRLGSWSGGGEQIDIPDPYYGNPSRFDFVFHLLEDVVAELAAHLIEKIAK